MRAVILGVEPKVNLVVFKGKAIIKRALRCAGSDVFVALHGSADHIFLEVVHN